MSTFDRVRFKLGACIALCGVPLAMLLNFAYPIAGSWTPLIMASSALFLFNGFKGGGMLSKSGILTVIILFQLLMLLYWYIDDVHLLSMLSFHIFVIVFFFIAKGNPELHKLNYINELFIYSGFLSIIFAILEYLEFFSFEYWYALGLSLSYERTLEVFTANIAAYTNLVTCLMLFSVHNKKYINLIYLILCFVDFYVIVYSGKRSYFVASVFAVAYMLYKTRLYKRYFPHILVIIIVSITAVPQIQDSIIELVERTISGFTDVYGGKAITYDENSSSAIRAYTLSQTLRDFDSFTFSELIFGRGYFSYYIDNPILESYLDMGILGVLMYGAIIVVYPIRKLIKNDINNKLATLTLLLVLLHTFICLTNNNPYMYLPYPSVIMLAIYNNIHKYNNSNDNY